MRNEKVILLKPEHLNDTSLKRFFRSYEVGDYLFQQGKNGNTLHLIVQGTIRLFFNTLQVNHLVGFVGPGEVLGEKTIFMDTPYKRKFSAQVHTPCTILEIDNKSIKELILKIPDFGLQVLRVVSERLDTSAELISIMQLRDPIHRLTQYMVYHCHRHVKKMEIPMTTAELAYAVNLDEKFVEQCINDLVNEKILTGENGGFSLRDENALINYIPDLRRAIAA